MAQLGIVASMGFGLAAMFFGQALASCIIMGWMIMGFAAYRAGLNHGHY
jgi:hypothetical protein